MNNKILTRERVIEVCHAALVQNGAARVLLLLCCDEVSDAATRENAIATVANLINNGTHPGK
jgi:hypothetical protein